MKKQRADEALFETLNLESIQLARALIMEGRVMAGDRKILRASETLREGDVLRVKGELDAFVSRGAHKLKKAVEVFRIDLKDRVCVDVGASTGGFTDVMLRNGAGRVYSVDVGYNLLDYRLRSDPRVVCMERTNARFLKPEDFNPRPSFGATDVSFISLKAVLPAALAVLGGDESLFVALVKRKNRTWGRRAWCAIGVCTNRSSGTLRTSFRPWAGRSPAWIIRPFADRRATSNS